MSNVGAVARLNLELREDIHGEFKTHCDVEGRTQSDVVRTLILDWNRGKREEAYHRKLLGKVGPEDGR